MKTRILYVVLLLVCSSLFTSCEQEDQPTISHDISTKALKKLEAAGYDVTDKAPIQFEDGYLVEGDIYLSFKDIMNLDMAASQIGNQKQYQSTNLVSTNRKKRRIKIYVDPSFDEVTQQGINIAINRYNALRLRIKFRRVSKANTPDITIKPLTPLLAIFGVLGSAGFPDENGDPFNTVNLSSLLSLLEYDKEAIATVVAHELGHTIGFRHTDYFDRGISCGEQSDGFDEGPGTNGAIHIPGTPTGAEVEQASWMLSCLNKTDRPFNADDIIALKYLY